MRREPLPEAPSTPGTFHDWIKGLGKDDGAFKKFADWATHHQDDFHDFSLGIGVLAATPGADAANLLLRFLKESESNPPRRLLILNAITLSELELGEGLRDYLLESPEVGGAVDLALGASLQKPSTQKMGIPEIERRILLNLSRCRTEGECVGVVEAMGNSGDPVFEEALLNGLESDLRRIREKSALASRFMPEPVRSRLEQAALERGVIAR